MTSFKASTIAPVGVTATPIVCNQKYKLYALRLNLLKRTLVDRHWAMLIPINKNLQNITNITMKLRLVKIKMHQIRKSHLTNINAVVAA